MRISTIRSVVVLVLIAATFVLIQNVSGVTRTPIVKSLLYFPSTLGEWEATSKRESSEQVIKVLGVDDYIEYNYIDREGLPMNFYVAYYEAVGNGGAYHSPRNCIPGGGWGIEATRTVEVIPAGADKPVKVSEMVIRNGNEHQVVLYWYQNRGRVIHSEYWEKIYLVTDAVLKQRRDGTFVRLMAYAPDGDIDDARKRLNRFSSLVLTELKSFLPGSEI